MRAVSSGTSGAGMGLRDTEAPRGEQRHGVIPFSIAVCRPAGNSTRVSAKEQKTGIGRLDAEFFRGYGAEITLLGPEPARIVSGPRPGCDLRGGTFLARKKAWWRPGPTEPRTSRGADTWHGETPRP